jgi:hypothetical protein
MEANPLTEITMAEGHEYNPDADPQQRMEQIGSAFESQDYALVVPECNELMRRWAREGQQDDALELAQKVEKYRVQIEDAQPELLNGFDASIAEAYLYAGDSENENLTGAAERYQRVADTELVDVPVDGTQLPAAERTKYCEVFNAMDRLGDEAFLGGRYKEAGNNFADALLRRAEFMDDPNEQGPIACANYGAAASAFMDGELEKARGFITEALQRLEGLEASEDTLYTHVQTLEVAIDQFEGLDTDQRQQVLDNLDNAIRQQGGSNGGVKHFNFGEMYTEAVKEISEEAGEM